jgi:hypothetical protein
VKQRERRVEVVQRMLAKLGRPRSFFLGLISEFFVFSTEKNDCLPPFESSSSSVNLDVRGRRILTTMVLFFHIVQLNRTCVSRNSSCLLFLCENQPLTNEALMQRADSRQATVPSRGS